MNDINWHARAEQTTFQVKNFIDGAYIDCLGDVLISKHAARNGALLYQFAEGTGVEVDQAVANAKAAFEDGRWADLSIYERQAVMEKLADLLEANHEELALYECMDVGKPITSALNQDIGAAINNLRSAARAATSMVCPSGSNGGVIAYQERTPVGVVGGIVGWNFPLTLAAQKVGPALMMGNSLVLKPSEFTSLSACRFAELAIEAGVPNGVFNVVNGAGKTVGDRLARHPDVGLMTFVGSSATGKQMLISAGQSNMKRVILECGGKSPYLVFDDCPADLDMLAADIVDTAFPNQGALCVAGTRLLLQAGIREKLLPKILKLTQALVPQDPLDPDTGFGAIMDRAHMHKVLGYIDSGKKEGAELLLGGNQVRAETGGFYIEPTIFDQVDPNAKIAQEEIFGPVLSVFTFETEEQAIAIANNSDYGLAAYAATMDSARARRLGRKLNAGIFACVSTSTPRGGGVSIPIEGHKQSGFGLEGGVEGLKAYTVATMVNQYI
jgi:acyl-CoA reductase-like NAD-dependent aldehyde dehydrogenase